jgi:multimeric flavodoxin WrbA
MKIIGFNGSPHRKGPVASLLNAALKSAESEVKALQRNSEVKRYDLVDVVRDFHDGSYDGEPATLKPVFSDMRDADGFLFATPAHWFNVSSLMKCFIDWMTSHEFDFQGKVFGTIVHCEEDGGNQAAAAIVLPLLHMGLLIAPYSAFFKNRHGAEQSEAGWQLVDHRLVGKNVVRLAACIAHNQRGWAK